LIFFVIAGRIYDTIRAYLFAEEDRHETGISGCSAFRHRRFCLYDSAGPIEHFIALERLAGKRTVFRFRDLFALCS
jgi:hypothetical protein